MKINPLIVALLASLFFTNPMEAQQKGQQPNAKVYRWVDESGAVHYTESLPPDFEDKKADVLDGQGITKQKDLSLVPPPPPPPAPKAEEGELPRDSSGMRRPAPLFKAAQLKAQQDALLLLRYDSDQEILDAMQVEINQLDYDKRLLTTSGKSLLEAYNGNVREAAERQTAGIKVEDQLIKDIQSLKQSVALNSTTLAGLQIREDSIREMFETELERYRLLSAAAAENN